MNNEFVYVTQQSFIFIWCTRTLWLSFFRFSILSYPEPISSNDIINRDVDINDAKLLKNEEQRNR